MAVAVLNVAGGRMIKKPQPQVRCRVLYIHNLDDQFGQTETGLEPCAVRCTDDKRPTLFGGPWQHPAR